MGMAGVLTVVFITLKLCGVIDWSWFWVISPLLICAVLVAAIHVYIEHTEDPLQKSLREYYSALRGK